MSSPGLSNLNINIVDIIRRDEICSSQQNSNDLQVEGISLSSHEVAKGDLFLIMPPIDQSDTGLSYMTEAIAKGARVIIKEASLPIPTDTGDTLFIDVYNARLLKSKIAQRLFPGQPGKIVTVTGTNGKTSVVEFSRQIFGMLGCKSASIGTLGLTSEITLKDMPELDLTSPDPFLMHQTLSKMKSHGISHVAIESSSHSLDQYRFDGIDFSAAGFTNLSQDHLDYHYSMDRYFEAKKALFSRVLPEGETAVLNADINYFDDLSRLCKARGHRVIGYGKRADNGLKVLSITIKGPKQLVTLTVNDRRYDLVFNFIGKFQVLNALCAAGLVMGTGIPAMDVIPLLEHLTPAPGRLELMGTTKSGAAVYVDYAHTPDALKTALLSVRTYVTGMLTLLFGAGGDRDHLKRREMGEVASQFSDLQIVSDDNPRTENPAKIRSELMAPCPNAQEIGDRKEAIKHALKNLKKNDALLIAGKGHESHQIIGKKKIPFSDRDCAREMIIETGGHVFND